MFWPILTPAAPSFEISTYAAAVWRLVEAQHRVSTLKLVDNLDEQALLERMIEKTKPWLPPEFAGLDYLLAAPFRYDSIYPQGSRFRRAGRTEGVFYASEHVETAVAEMAFYRLLFYAESPLTPFPDAATDFSAFSVRVETRAALDLMRPEIDDAAWNDPVDYEKTQALADSARKSGVEIIRYRSVRDMGGRANVAVLTATAFLDKKPMQWRTWRLKVGSNGVSALCDFPVIRLSFDCNVFVDDPRLAGFVWERR
jgi:RES domain